MEVRGIGSIGSGKAPNIRVVQVKLQGVGKLDLGRALKAVFTGGLSELDIKKAAEAAAEAARKIANGVKDAAEAALQFTKVTALFPARSSFILLIKMNFRGFATRMKRMEDTSHIESTWKKLGGAWGDVNAAINQGWDKPYVFGVKKGEGARDESDADFIKATSLVFYNENGVTLGNAVFDTANPVIPGLTNGKILSWEIGNSGIGEYTVAVIVAGASAVLAAIVPLIADKKADKEEEEIQAKLDRGEEVPMSDYEKLWRNRALADQAQAYSKAKSEGKTDVQAGTIAAKAYLDSMNKQRADHSAEVKRKAEAAKTGTESDSAWGVNFGALLKQYWPVAALAVAAVVAPKLLKIK